ncbi:RecQ family ATP-dependent DNA helicase [Algibacillus agarilyticus]|uniref:RecQ family ATP-dependent DNA helicase n=1 Tax=Algibacillus agarilyticus TaxID=2234133 RepID=UPI000DCFEDE7|nr:RecQ family ATP-dependent DNA helicase [Algibacillus agarilyticus]
MNELNQRLQEQFGFPEFRLGQEPVVRQLLAGQSTLAIFPTGSGKSLCYQFTALQLPHLTLVVSPLLALMKDQIDFLQQKGIAAASIDSTLSSAEHQQVVADVRSGQTKILMVSVERFKNERFRQLISSVPISMLVVDEAHCISEWGHNFRPDYLKLPSYQRELKIPLVLLLTATATHAVKLDMAKRFSIESTHIVQTGFYRANLDLNVQAVAMNNKPHALQQFILQQSGDGIVYVTLQQQAEQVANTLKNQGINAVAYHAGLKDDLRQDIQQRFMAGQISVVVATIAFGMGVDKSDIRFVVHYELPKSIENYSQEIGRAGRDGQQAHCLLLADLSGLNTLENFVYGDTPEQDSIQIVLSDIQKNSNHNLWECQLHSLSNQSNIKQLPLKTLLVQLELLGILDAKYSYFAELKVKYIIEPQTILSNFEAERVTFLQAVFAHIEMKKTWGVLNMESLLNTYPCDRKRVITALDYLHEQGMLVVQTSGVTDVYQINQQFDVQALSAKLAHYFLDKEQKEIERIAQLVAFFQTNNCLSYALASYFDDHKAPQQCGHCAVCRGLPVTLTLPAQPTIATKQIQQAMQALQQHMQTKQNLNINTTTYCRFLAGMSEPLLAKSRVKNVQGYALCENVRYADIKQQVMAISRAY